VATPLTFVQMADPQFGQFAHFSGRTPQDLAAYRRQPIPHSYAVLAAELAAAVEVVALELDEDRMATAAQPALIAVGVATSEVERTDDLSAEVVLAQLRSVIADLLLLTGMTSFEATDAIPPVRH